MTISIPHTAYQMSVPVIARKSFGTAVLDLPKGLKANTPIEITAEETSETRRYVNVTIDTRSVIQGEELEEAKARARHIMVS